MTIYRRGRYVLIFLLVISFLASCAPQAAAPIAVTESTNPQATLPATLTPIPTQAQTQATPTALYAPISLSAEDEAAYQQALKDIPVYRQGNLLLTLVDTNGNPLSGYQVNYRQTSHDFLFGGVAYPYYATSLQQAGMNTITEYMGWNWIEPEMGNFTLDFANYWLGIDELKSGGMFIKTNVVYDTGELAPYYQGVAYDEFLSRLYNHVATTVKRFAPDVDDWEAVLEPNFGNHNPMNLTKDQYYEAISTSIRAIRDNDPTAWVEINFGYNCGGIDWLDNTKIIQEMLDRKIDFDVIGLQFYDNATTLDGTVMPKRSLSELSACYDQYETLLAPYGKRVVGSEFSVPSDLPDGQLGYWNVPWSEESQAQYLTTAYTIFFAKQHNLGLVWWNTVEPSPHVYQGGIVKQDGTPKKAYYALQNLINSWTTTGTGTTDSNGSLTFRGFGGNYELEIMNSATGESMVTQAHITEQKENSQTVSFVGSNWLTDQRTTLEKLVTYWQEKGDASLAQKGKDYLALVDHHVQVGEWNLAKQTLSAALEDLAITTEILVPMDQLIPVKDKSDSGVTTENGSYLLWGAGTIHYPCEFPTGTVTVEIKAHAHNTAGESPIMVAGVGANYSQVWQVANEQSQEYTFTTITSGNEKDLTIRFPYDEQIYNRINQQNGNVGELKLYVDEVRLIIKTTQINE
jgi:endo-1,4-beta-xylanase